MGGLVPGSGGGGSSSGSGGGGVGGMRRHLSLQANFHSFHYKSCLKKSKTNQLLKCDLNLQVDKIDYASSSKTQKKDYFTKFFESFLEKKIDKKKFEHN